MVYSLGWLWPADAGEWTELTKYKSIKEPWFLINQLLVLKIWTLNIDWRAYIWGGLSYKMKWFIFLELYIISLIR